MSLAISEGTPIHRAVVHLMKGDITELDVDAFVFYATSDLKLGSGYGTAISVRGGPTIQRELDELAPVEPGRAVTSGAGNLNAEYIIHAVGPKFREADAEEKLQRTMVSALEQAETKRVRRIAFPAMGAGYYGIPPELCARVMLNTLRRHLAGGTLIEEVTVCVLDSRQLEAFRSSLEPLADGAAT